MNSFENTSIEILTPSKFANMENFHKAKGDYFEKQFKFLSENASENYPIINDKIFFSWDSIQSLSKNDLVFLLINDYEILNDVNFNILSLDALDATDWIKLIKHNSKFGKHLNDTILGRIRFEIKYKKMNSESELEFNNLLKLLPIGVS
jgi:hypothetical protein